MKLYDVAEQYLAVQEMAYDPDVDPNDIGDTLEAVDGIFEDKADAIAEIISGMKSDISEIRREEDRLYARRKALENRAEWLKGYLESAMKLTGKTKFKTSLFSYAIQKNGGIAPLVIDKPDEIPVKYLIPQPPKTDGDAIRKLLSESGTEDIGWAHLEPRGESLRIR